MTPRAAATALALGLVLAPGAALSQTGGLRLSPAPAAPSTATPSTSRPAAPKPSPATPDADLAFGAYQRGQYLTAFREANARLKGGQGDAAAMTLLGELYNQGLGVREDPAKAVEFYRRAAAKGDAKALSALGLMAIDGRGMAKNPQEGRSFLEQAAAKGEPRACYNLALLLLATGDSQDLAKAIQFMRIAANAEIGEAQYGLGVLTQEGRGLPKNPGEAARWFLKAAGNGNIPGEVEYAIKLFNGEGVAKDERLAARYFRHAATQGNAIAQNRLARLYVIGKGVPQNGIEAAAWHMAASAQGLSDPWLDKVLRSLSDPDRARAERLAKERFGGS